MRTSYVTQRRSTTRRHNTGRGLVVLADVQAEGTIKDRLPQRQRGQTRYANRLVCRDDFRFHRAVGHGGLLLTLRT